jgi:hypothetical protein
MPAGSCAASAGRNKLDSVALSQKNLYISRTMSFKHFISSSLQNNGLLLAGLLLRPAR